MLDARRALGAIPAADAAIATTRIGSVPAPGSAASTETGALRRSATTVGPATTEAPRAMPAPGGAAATSPPPTGVPVAETAATSGRSGRFIFAVAIGILIAACGRRLARRHEDQLAGHLPRLGLSRPYRIVLPELVAEDRRARFRGLSGTSLSNTIALAVAWWLGPISACWPASSARADRPCCRLRCSLGSPPEDPPSQPRSRSARSRHIGTASCRCAGLQRRSRSMRLQPARA